MFDFVALSLSNSVQKMSHMSSIKDKHKDFYRKSLKSFVYFTDL